MVSRQNGQRQKATYEQLLEDDPSGMAMLDQALEGASTEEVARVRGVLLRFGIETDHEFYIIFVAIGQLLVLVEEAPENWRALFDDVHQELKQWSQENFKSLQSIRQHAQTAADLIAVLRQLLDSMRHSDSRSAAMSQTLSSLSRKLSTIESSLASVQTSNRNSQKTLDLLGSLLETLAEFPSRRDWISICSAVLGVVTVGMLVGSNRTMNRRLDTQELLIRRQSERIAWLLDKANREECVTGIKPPSDPQCRQFQ